jgi:hypothetical protein
VKLKPLQLLQAPQAILLEPDIVIVVEVVDADNPVAPLEQHFPDPSPDEPRTTSDQYLHKKLFPTIRVRQVIYRERWGIATRIRPFSTVKPTAERSEPEAKP